MIVQHPNLTYKEGKTRRFVDTFSIHHSGRRSKLFDEISYKEKSLQGVCGWTWLSGIKSPSICRWYNLLGEATIANVKVIKSLMHYFELIAGLRVNFYKSSCGGIGMEGVMVERMADLLNCRILALPFIYLRLLIGTNPRKNATWSPIIDKFTNRLANWKNKQLCLAGSVSVIILYCPFYPSFIYPSS